MIARLAILHSFCLGVGGPHWVRPHRPPLLVGFQILDRLAAPLAWPPRSVQNFAAASPGRKCGLQKCKKEEAFGPALCCLWDRRPTAPAGRKGGRVWGRTAPGVFWCGGPP